ATAAEGEAAAAADGEAATAGEAAAAGFGAVVPVGAAAGAVVGAVGVADVHAVARTTTTVIKLARQYWVITVRERRQPSLTCQARRFRVLMDSCHEDAA